MLKITIDEKDQLTSIRLEGKLAGPWVGELERVWSASRRKPEGGDFSMDISVDISEVTFIDPEGRQLLARMYGDGVKLRVSGCMNRSIVEQIEQEHSGGGRVRQDSRHE